MRREVQKLQNLSRTLVLQGVHEDTQEKLPLSLNRVYRRELELYQAEAFFKHQVEKECRWGEDLPRINGHYIDFSQSFRNLVDNALEAMEGRDRRHLTVETAYRQGRIVVRLGDTGQGIPPGALPWIFEPFFTTKRTGGREGAGLGLFMVRRLLAPYLGEIRVDSGPGGTWVSLSLVVS
jgi:two-component system, NtrC family, sensor kinase